MRPRNYLRLSRIELPGTEALSIVRDSRKQIVILKKLTPEPNGSIETAFSTSLSKHFA